MAKPAEQVETLQKGTVDFVSPGELEERLATGRPLRIKLGCDPSAPDLHFGHLVPLDLLRRFQQFGHTIIFLVGDFTARIGDPSGRSRTRPALSPDEVEANARTYTDQVSEVLDPAGIEVRFNSEWMDRMTPTDFIRLAAHQPVARMLERDDFRTRYREGVSIAIHEFLYPLVQAYDSVALEADVEIGGTDQLFNLLLGREIQRAYGQRPQIVITAPLLVGLDGHEKMSKSLGNAVPIRDEPEEMYGKVMSIPDGILGDWVELLLPRDLEGGEAARDAGDPRARKAALARRMVERFHGPEAGRAAEEHFDRVFRQHKPPEDLPEVEVPSDSPEGPTVLELIRTAGLAASGSEGRRLVSQGGVRIDGEPASDPQSRVAPGSHLVQVGKRRFVRVAIRKSR